MTHKPVNILIVSNDSYAVNDLVTAISERLAGRVEMHAIFRDYHFGTDGVEIIMGNGLCKTRSEWGTHHIFFPQAHMAALKKGIPYISVNRPFAVLRAHIAQFMQIWLNSRVDNTVVEAPHKRIIDKLEKQIIKIEKRRNTLSPATA